MKVHKLVFSPIEVNTYILEDPSGDCAIIDCGCYDNQESERLGKFLEEKELKPVLLLNTHCHLDHVFGNKFMLERYGLRTHSGLQDESNRKNAIRHADLFGLEMDDPPEPEAFIDDNQTITFASTGLRSLFVPGHSPGSIAFYSERDGCVFTGDALFSGSIGRTDLPGGDYETLIKSIKERLFSLPSSTVVYPGHGEKTDIKTEMNHNPYLKD